MPHPGFGGGRGPGTERYRLAIDYLEHHLTSHHLGDEFLCTLTAPLTAVRFYGTTVLKSTNLPAG